MLKANAEKFIRMKPRRREGAKAFGLRRIITAVTLAFCATALGLAETRPVSGTIHLSDGSSISFDEVLSLIYILPDEAESVSQNVSEWTIHYSPAATARSIPLAWVSSIEIVDHEIRPGYRCIFNPKASIESVTGVRFTSEYRTLEWIKVRTHSSGSEYGGDDIVYFAAGDQLNIRKIVFSN